MKGLLKKKIIIIPLLLFLILGGYFGYNSLINKDKKTRYLIAAVEKNTLIVSVSGSGQVLASDQIDIKPKVNGEVAALYAEKGEEVKARKRIMKLDDADFQKATRDAETSLETAKLELEELSSPPDELTLLQAENSLISTKRNLEKTEDDYQQISLDAEQTLDSAYDDGYNTVSNTFLKLPDFMKDLKDTLGTELQPKENIVSYKLILGSGSIFIQKLLDDYERADDLFNKNFAFFITVSRDADRDTIYKLLTNTLETTKAISQTLESSRNMFDAIVNSDYKHLTIASTVDQMRPKILSDISSVNSNISSLQKTKDTIDDTNQNTPIKLKNARIAVESAKENLKERELSLAKLKAGPDELDIRAKKITIQQKEDTLLTAKQDLANCYISVPFDGVIADIKVKKGDTVSAGTILASIVTQQKIAEISLNEVDAAKVKIGQKATLTFDAIPDLSISGKVLDVDTVGTTTQGVVSYGVKIAFDTQDERVKPGMSVAADIIIDVRENVLVVPNNAIKSQGNSYSVELVAAFGEPRPEGREVPEETKSQLSASISGVILPNPPTRQSVEIGLSNDLSTEITSGLKEGDIVVTSTINSSKAQTTQTQRNQGFQIPMIGSQSGSQRVSPTRELR